MDIPRRFLPSLASMLALEAVDRLGSAKAAAEDLALTQSAVSRQIKVLEDQLGVRLVQPARGGLALTPATVDYCAAVRESLTGLARAGLKLKANPEGGSLDLSILPTFGIHWLAPRLRRFGLAHPEVSLNLSTRLRPFDFARESFDAAIHFGARDWPGVNFLKIAGEEVLPVCAPGFLPTPLPGPEALLSFPLLHLDTRPRAWEDWFLHYGVDLPAPKGMLLDQFTTIAQAAALEMGVALLPRFLAEAEIALGRLTVAYGGPVPSAGSYYLVWPEDRPMRAPLRRFADWIRCDMLEEAPENPTSLHGA